MNRRKRSHVVRDQRLKTKTSAQFPGTPAPRQDPVQVGQVFRNDSVAYKVEALVWTSGPVVMVVGEHEGEQVPIPRQVRYQIASVAVLDPALPLDAIAAGTLDDHGRLERRVIRADTLLPSRGLFARVHPVGSL